MMNAAAPSVGGERIALMPEGRGIFPGLTVAEIFDLSLWSANIRKDEHAEARFVAGEIERLVDEAIATQMPELAEERQRRPDRRAER